MILQDFRTDCDHTAIRGGGPGGAECARCPSPPWWPSRRVREGAPGCPSGYDRLLLRIRALADCESLTGRFLEWSLLRLRLRGLTSTSEIQSRERCDKQLQRVGSTMCTSVHTTAAHCSSGPFGNLLLRCTTFGGPVSVWLMSSIG